MTQLRKDDGASTENAACLTGNRTAVAGQHDRLKAGETRWSAALVEHLLDSGHLFLIATHQQKLTELADGASAPSRHFLENLREEGLVFDYLLREGPARTRNPLRILEREGYPPGLIARARRRLEASVSTPGPTPNRSPAGDGNRLQRLE